MNIVMLNCEFPPIGGGAGNANLHLLRELSGKDGLKVDVLTSGPNPGLSSEQFSANITIYKVGLHKRDLHFWRRTEVVEWLIKARDQYRKLLAQNNYDLAHAFFGFPTAYLCLSTASRLPYIISLRGSDVPGKHVRLQLDYKILGPLFKRIWKNATALVACSEGLKARAVTFMPGLSIEVIPNGVDLELFSPDPTPEKPDTLRLLTVGRLSPTKRVEMLIDAVEMLQKQGVKVQLTIAGSGALERRLRQTVTRKNLADVVRMAGRVEPEKMPRLYRQNDIFVSATMQEGMSNAMLEAMASGLPIVTTACEGLDELISDNGIIVRGNDPQALAQAVRALYDDWPTLDRMSKAAREHAHNFSWKNVAQKYLNLYEKVRNETNKS